MSHRIAPAARLSLMICLMAGPALADLNSAEIEQLRMSRNAQVLTSDGVLVGETDGGSVSTERARLFIDPVPGSLFSRIGKPVVLTTPPGEIDLVNGAWVLTSDRTRVRTRANFTQTEDAPISINLPKR